MRARPLLTFNNDLLLDPEELAAARDAFPDSAYVFDHPELRELFVAFDDPANAAKRRSRRAGLAAVTLAVLALFGTSAAPLYETLTPPLPNLIAVTAALLGLAGGAIGFGGLMLGRSKREWLHRRLVTERLRQFHFQTFRCRVAEIAASLGGTEQQREFMEKRRQWFAAFKLRFGKQPGGEFSHFLQSENFSEVWLYPAPTAVSTSVANSLTEDHFAAYEQLRIRHQLRFAASKLEKAEGLFSSFNLQEQRALITYGNLGATLGLIVLEVLVLLAVLLHWELFPEKVAHIAAVWCALVALGVRTLEEGLQPKRELERYRRYWAALEDIRARFEVGDRLEKLDIMVEMERLSFQEMCDFLRSNYDARFIM